MATDAPADAHERIARNVRRTVGIRALRRISGLVEEIEAEDRSQRRARWVVLAAVVVLAVATALVLVWPAMARAVSAMFA